MRHITITSGRGRSFGRFVDPQAVWSSGELLFIRDYAGTVHTFPWPWHIAYDRHHY